MKVQTELVVREVQRYVAEDGKVFATEADCKRYEYELSRSALEAKVKLIETCKAAENFTPLDSGEYMEYHEYKWYRPKNREEADLLIEYFNLEYDAILTSEIGDWVCIEESDDCGWSCPLKYSIIHTKKFFELLGYDVTITKKEKNHV